ncbi:MAG TPA: hypothetical protein V6D08_10760 [Candidatus Obscuribacterales bacterium]
MPQGLHEETPHERNERPRTGVDRSARIRTGTRASAIAFAAMMAFVPLIALVMTIGAYLLYGSLGGVMMLLIWFWITSLVLLAAAEMNRLVEIASAARSPSENRHGDGPGCSGGSGDRKAG